MAKYYVKCKGLLEIVDANVDPFSAALIAFKRQPNSSFIPIADWVNVDERGFREGSLPSEWPQVYNPTNKKYEPLPPEGEPDAMYLTDEVIDALNNGV